MAETEKFKTGNGFYAFTSFAAAMFFPPVMALKGQYFGIAFYALLVVAYKTLQRRRFLEANGIAWLCASVLVFLLGIANFHFLLGLDSVLPVVVVVFGVALLLQILVSILAAYRRNEF